jgi:hypothetical protein
VNAGWQKLAGTVVLATSIALVALGARKTYTVYPDPTLPVELPPVSIPDFSQPSFAPPKAMPELPPSEYSVKDLQFIENTTFTGIALKDGKLFFTYDPTKKRGKRSCPT